LSDSGGEYKRSYLDKHGPEGADFYKAAVWLIVPVVFGGLIGGAYFANAGYTSGAILAGTVVGAVLGGAGSLLFIRSVSDGVGGFFRSVIEPNRTEYERQYSREDALVMRGDVEGALASYESIIAEAPNEAQPKIRAAELYAKSGMNERAEMLYRAVQRLPDVAPKDDVFVSNRLVDLYLAWPGNEGKGLRELRRLIDSYPQTDVAERARAGLVTLKSRLGSTG
jgi:tetratricopeptide (TPR) repeat protein